MTIKGADGGEGGIIIPKSALILIVLTVLGAMGTGGFFMGVQSSDVLHLDRTLKAMEDHWVKTDAAIADIQSFVAVIKSKTEYSVGRQDKRP